MKPVTAIWLVALGLVVGIPVGAFLQYKQRTLEKFINKLKSKQGATVENPYKTLTAAALFQAKKDGKL